MSIRGLDDPRFRGEWSLKKRAFTAMDNNIVWFFRNLADTSKKARHQKTGSVG
jgi:hypothetical protein